MIGPIERLDIDGVPVLRVDSGSGRTCAALMFRVGRPDEALPTAGVTHLIEHCALADSPGVAYQVNGAVDDRHTTFSMESSDPADVASFVDLVCRGLAADRRHSLDQHKRILRTEAAGRGVSAHAACLVRRYGAAGPGLLGYEEFGLHRLEWDEIDAWRSAWFVAGNAVLAVAGALPRGLRIGLPAGAPPPAGPAPAQPALPPGYLVGGQGGIGLSLAGPRSWESALTLDLAQRRLTRLLRHERGLSYQVHARTVLCGPQATDTWLAADALPEHLPVVAHLMLSALEELADRGFGTADLEDHLRRRRDVLDSPAGRFAFLQQQARGLLDGRALWDAERALATIAAIPPVAVAGTARDLLGQAIVVTPTPVPAVEGRMPRMSVWSADAITGPQIHSPAGYAVTVTDEGAMLTAGRAQRLTVRYADAAALLRWNDGQRELIGQDGARIRLDPAGWLDGERLIARVDAGVDPRLQVRIDQPGPPRLGEEPLAAGDQRSPGVPAPARRRLGVLVALIIGVLSVALALVTRSGPTFLPGPVFISDAPASGSSSHTAAIVAIALLIATAVAVAAVVARRRRRRASAPPPATPQI